MFAVHGQADPPAGYRFQFRTAHPIAYRLTSDDALSRAAAGERIE